MPTSSSHGRVSGPVNDFLSIGKDVAGALTEVPYVGAIFQVLEKIGEIRDEVKENKEHCEELLQMVQDYARTLFEALDKLVKSSHADRLRSIEDDLRQFKSILESTAEALSKLSPKRRRDRWRQILNRAQVKDDIEKCERELRRFHERFTIGTLTKLAMDVFEASELSTRRQALTQLPYAERASWNPDLRCLEGTRGDLLRGIYDWFESRSGSSTVPAKAKILWLQGPAGSGKSAVAHSVAAQATERGILVSSFFLTPGTTRNEATGNQGASMQVPSLHNLISTLLYDLARWFQPFADAIVEELHSHRYLLSDPQRQFTELLMRYAHLLDTSRPLLWIIDGFDELRRLDKHSGGFLSRDALRLLELEVPKLPDNFIIFVTSRPFDTPLLSQPPTHLRTLIIDISTTSSKQDVEMVARAKLAQLAREKGRSAWPDEPTIARFISRADGLPLWVTVVTNFLRTSLSPESDLNEILSPDGDHEPDLDADLTDEMSKIYGRILDSCADWERRRHRRWLGDVLGILLALERPLSLESLCSLFHNDSLSDVIASTIQSLRPVLIGVDSGEPIEFIHLSFRDFLNSPSQEIVRIDPPSGHATLALCCFRLLNTKLASSTAQMHWAEHKGNPNPTFPNYQNPPACLIYSSANVMEHLEHRETGTSDKLVTATTTFLSSTFLQWLGFQACFGKYRSLRCVIDQVKGLGIPTNQIDQSMSCADAAWAVMGIGDWLYSVDRIEEALESHIDSTRIFRQLVSDQPQASNFYLAISLTNLSCYLSALGSREEALKAIKEAVELYRSLASERPRAFNPDLALSLSNLSTHLSALDSREEALKAIREAVELYRPLASERPQAFESYLAGSLSNLSNCLSDLGCEEEALKAVKEAVELYRPLASERPQAFNHDLARSLNNLSNYFSYFGSRGAALSAIEEAVELRCQLASERPQAFNSDLAGSLSNLSNHLSDIGSLEKALSASQEAVEIYRPLASERPQAFNSNLARSLTNLSNHLSALGFREEALKAIEEAVELRRQLASERPQVFNRDLVRSLTNLSSCLSDIGSRAQALTAIQESIVLHRQLASERPQAFHSDLVKSLHNMALHLCYMERLDEALVVITEATTLYEELATEHPVVFMPMLDGALSLSSSIQERLSTMHDSAQDNDP